MRLLVTGAAGMLGSAICPVFEQAGHEILKTDLITGDPGVQSLNVCDPVQIYGAIASQHTDVVLHLAAETDVDKCEKDPAHAHATNGQATLTIAQACAKHGAVLVYVSTAGVFDGQKTTAYTEADNPNPIIAYGRSKLFGEEAVKRALESHYIVRAGWMVGGRSKDKKFVGMIARQIEQGQRRIFAVTDKLGTPTYTADFAKNLLALLQTRKFGLYHMGCRGSGSRYDVAAHILKVLGRADIELIPVTSEYFSQDFPAMRPKSEMLENDNLNKIGLNLMRDWRIALAEYLQSL